METELPKNHNVENYDLSVFSIATGKYIDFWIDLCASAGTEMLKNNSIQWVIASDSLEKIPNDINEILGNRLTKIQIASFGWPQATLLRYQIIYENSRQILGQHFLFLDADMRFVDNLWFEKITKVKKTKSDIHLVQHPGFYRPKKNRLVVFYLINLRYTVKDLWLQIKTGALGSWEKDYNSLAYVPRRLRKNYVCGGCWFGKRQEILQMCELLSDRVAKDEKKGKIAIFHDESHLNWFASHNTFELESPEFCFEPTYPQLRNIHPIIEAVNKGEHSVWIRS